MPVVLLNESVAYQDVNSRYKLATITPEKEVDVVEWDSIIALPMMRPYEVENLVASSVNRSYEVGHCYLSARRNIAQ